MKPLSAAGNAWDLRPLKDASQGRLTFKGPAAEELRGPWFNVPPGIMRRRRLRFLPHAGRLAQRVLPGRPSVLESLRRTQRFSPYRAAAFLPATRPWVIAMPMELPALGVA